MSTYKYKIVEFAPTEKMSKVFNELGAEGWELVSVTPIRMSVNGRYEAINGGLGGGETSGSFDTIAAYFKKEIKA